jgi:hypothetical protein
MNCNLSDVWKQTLKRKAWEDKQAAEKKAREDAHVRLTAEVKELTKEGWLFKCEEQYHPHNNDTWLEALFKSPRMLRYRWYDITTDLKREEARSLANSYSKQILPVAHELIEAELFDYFYENQAATSPPQLNIQVTNALPSRQQ